MTPPLRCPAATEFLWELPPALCADRPAQRLQAVGGGLADPAGDPDRPRRAPHGLPLANPKARQGLYTQSGAPNSELLGARTFSY